MQPQLSVVFTLLTCAQNVTAAATDFSQYAYGKDIPAGMKMCYGDGLAYVGLKVPPFVSEPVNITLSHTDDQKFVVTRNATSGWEAQLSMYIGADVGNIRSVGFRHDNETNEDDAIFAGFGLFGGWAFNNVKAGEIEMNFVATPTNETDVYRVKWKTVGTKATGTNVPIALRTEAPVTPEG